jgi:hypothetical protein
LEGESVLRTTFRTTSPALLVPLEEAWEPYREVVTLADVRAMVDAGTMPGACLDGRYLVSVAALAERFLAATVKPRLHPAHPPRAGRRRS